MNSAPFLDSRAAVRLTGAVYTPSPVAAAVIGVAMKGAPNRRLRVLEPSAGDGAFLGQLAELMPEHDYVAVDIDEKVVDTLRLNAGGWPKSTKLHARDFIQFACDAIDEGATRFDLVVGNPPFIRKHNFPPSFKGSLERLSTATGYPLLDLKNSWAAFLVASSQLLTDDGIVAFVLPYELVTVAYGQAVLQRMLKVFSRVDLYVSNEKAFPEIEQDAVIFVGRRAGTQPPGLYVQRVQQMSDLAHAVEHGLETAESRPMALDLNTFLLEPALMPVLRQIQADLPSFSEIATSAPGIVTAANEFFILRDTAVERLNLQPHVLPILKKQSIVDRSPVFSAKDFEALSRREPCRLLHVNGPVETFDASLQAYIDSGVEAGLPDRYKCRHRKRWYEVRLVQVAPGFFFKRSDGFPRICVNEAGVYITDTAYGVHPKESRTMRGICFSFYNSITMLFAEVNGRFYGGGVLELSPSELKGLPIAYHEPSDEEFEAFLEVHKKAGNDPGPILDFGDRWLSRHPDAAMIDLPSVRRAWASVRSHRLRHSSRSKAAGEGAPSQR
ncbi:MAG: class I SAM-dependent methyltransferase [Hyphomicrobiales bacterium]|nr:MAG: class I SAM-dependent methyltransferase [Hyphomicrobiales bacterium]